MVEAFSFIRNRRALVGISLFFLLAALVHACGQKPPAESGAASGKEGPEGVVALVGGDAISREEVEEFAALLLPGLRSDKTDQAARLDYLNTLIDEKLLVLEARARGLDSSRVFVAAFDQDVRQEVVQYYRERHLYPRIDITEDELQTRFIKERLNRERALNRLVVKSLEEAEQLRLQLERGADFGALASAYTIEKTGASRNGFVGFVNRRSVGRLRIPVDLFDDLATGVVSAPLSLQGFYQLILFSEDREAELDRYRSQVYKLIWKEKQPLQRRALSEELAAEFDLQVHGKGLEILASKQPGRRFYPQVSAAEAATPLYTYDGGQISVEDYINVFRASGGRVVVGDSLAVVKGTWQRVIPEVMFWEAARRKEYHKTAEMVRWQGRKKVEHLLKALRREIVEAEVSIEREEMQQFYYDNPKLFSAPVELKVQEILLDDLQQARAVRQRLDAGEDMDALAHLTRREGAAEAGGKLHLHSYEAPLYGEIVSRALESEPGQLVGPVKAEKGYSVFRLIDKDGGYLQPFDTVEKRVQATIRNHKESELFNALVGAVREKYVDQVQIFEDVLKTVKMPSPTSSPAAQN